MGFKRRSDGFRVREWEFFSSSGLNLNVKCCVRTSLLCVRLVLPMLHQLFHLSARPTTLLWVHCVSHSARWIKKHAWLKSDDGIRLSECAMVVWWIVYESRGTSWPHIIQLLWCLKTEIHRHTSAGFLLLPESLKLFCLHWEMVLTKWNFSCYPRVCDLFTHTCGTLMLTQGPQIALSLDYRYVNSWIRAGVTSSEFREKIS